MDPLACLRRLLEAFVDTDKDEAQMAAQDLADWLAKKGAMPSRFDAQEVMREVASPRPVMEGAPPPYADPAAGATPATPRKSGWPYQPIEKPPGTLPHR